MKIYHPKVFGKDSSLYQVTVKNTSNGDIHVYDVYAFSKEKAKHNIPISALPKNFEFKKVSKCNTWRIEG